MIDHLDPRQAFVFGSNIMGHHGGGAALYAFDNFGAEEGIGEGLTGQCYAFPTLNQHMQRYTRAELESIRDAFYRCAFAHPELTFLLTRVGCGIAGYPEEDMLALFEDAPVNVKKPAGWQ